MKALREWLRQRPEDGSDFLFVSQKGGRLDRSQFFRLFQSIAAAAGLPPEKRHPHALKHSIASHLVSTNVNLALVKQQLGHKSIGSTMRYVSYERPASLKSHHKRPNEDLLRSPTCQTRMPLTSKNTFSKASKIKDDQPRVQE